MRTMNCHALVMEMYDSTLLLEVKAVDASAFSDKHHRAQTSPIAEDRRFVVGEYLSHTLARLENAWLKSFGE